MFRKKEETVWPQDREGRDGAGGLKDEKAGGGFVINSFHRSSEIRIQQGNLELDFPWANSSVGELTDPV